MRLLWKNLSRVRLFQITFLLSSLGVASPDHLSPFFTWCGYFGKSHLGVAVPNHLSLSFTWCSFSRSPFPFLHLVRLLWKNLFRVWAFSLLLNGSPIFFSCSVLSYLWWRSPSLFWCGCKFSFSNHLLFNLSYVRLPISPLMVHFPFLLNHHLPFLFNPTHSRSIFLFW